jgi:aldose 1-epimerase
MTDVLQAVEGKALSDEETSYYDDLSDKLDLILTFTEHGWLHCVVSL